MNNNLIAEQPTVKYQVKLNGQVIKEAPSKVLAEQFVMTLGEEQQQKAVVVPVTEGGNQVLFG